MRRINLSSTSLTKVVASAGLASGLFFVATSEADAQKASPSFGHPDQSDEKKTAQPLNVAPIMLPSIKVGGESHSNTNVLNGDLGLSRLPDSLHDTPQTVVVIPHVMIEQQQATTVNQVLSYVPGITVATGEGNGGINGDQFRIRGFDASGDIYVDGLRDFGSYVRDDFTVEDVEVIKGPTSASFGNGSSGGVIELKNKKAHLGTEYKADISGGSGPYGRGVIDINQQINNTTAFRLVGMLHGQDVVDRNHVYSDRWGILASLGFGLGTDNQITFDYFHQYSKRRPDFGVPIPQGNLVSGAMEPVTEDGVSRSTYFGRDTDRQTQNADVLSAHYRGKISDWLTINNDTRFGVYSYDMRFTPSKCQGGFSYPTYQYDSCQLDVAQGNLNTPYSIWYMPGNAQRSYGGENVTTVRANFNTFGVRHELIAGVDVYSQHTSFDFYNFDQTTGPAGTLINPIYHLSQKPSVSKLHAIDATSWDVGPFISDRFWVLKTLSFLGSVRWDHYQVKGRTNNGYPGVPMLPIHSSSELASPRGSVIWQPDKHQSYYFNFARGFTPAGSNITSFSTSNGIQAGGPSPSLKPETSYSYEVGAKFNVLHDRLGLTAAAFRVDKNNASYTDPTTGMQTKTGESVTVQGFEAGLTGRITPAWDMQASYTYMDSKITSSSGGGWYYSASAVGNRAPYVSRHSLSLWTTYDIKSLFAHVRGLSQMPGSLVVGGGFNYRSAYYVDDAMLMRIPAYVSADAMISYDLSHYHAAVNVQNLNNALAYSSAFSSGYATPVAGRTVIATFGIRF
ncbi:TonB-dependent receptor [Acetobacter sp. DmW_043]|uniref:TonB-dependent receptor n=1 Tax=Acetobacter sp. DmW_043 TaxID=1670658 RepID=UPI000A3C7621|nr:TonB-dependent receptor [Acetobacter sp. DmW_043]OUI87902.1 TonB-dependent receptor [Acetobacter sp. DmW_043]